MQRFINECQPCAVSAGTAARAVVAVSLVVVGARHRVEPLQAAHGLSSPEVAHGILSTARRPIGAVNSTAVVDRLEYLNEYENRNQFDCRRRQMVITTSCI